VCNASHPQYDNSYDTCTTPQDGAGCPCYNCGLADERKPFACDVPQPPSPPPMQPPPPQLSGGSIGGIVGGCFVPVLLCILWFSGAFGKRCPSPLAKAVHTPSKTPEPSL